jgi:hypothetical protein
MTPNKANTIFSILVQHAGASEALRDNFIHTIGTGAEEYRFQGDLGFGGKFRPKTMTVDCYKEDLDDIRSKIIEETNQRLKEIAKMDKLEELLQLKSAADEAHNFAEQAERASREAYVKYDNFLRELVKGPVEFDRVYVINGQAIIFRREERYYVEILPIE